MNNMKRKKDKPMPFRASQWLQSKHIRSLPPNVRGLLIDMLCYMWVSPNRGYLLRQDGSKVEVVEVEEIEREMGVDSMGQSWLYNLAGKGIIAATPTGTIYSPRMVKDIAISKKRAVIGRIGGERTQFKKETPQAHPVAPASTPPKPAPVETTIFQAGEVETVKAPPKPKQQPAQKVKYADDVHLTPDEYAKLVALYGEDDTKGIIELLSNYKGQNGKRYKSDYKAILNWASAAYYQRTNINNNGMQRQNANRRPNAPDNQGTTSRTGATDATEVHGGGETPPKDYSERFV